MGAFNWIDIESRCPVCAEHAQIECQTHVASTFAGDDTGRFCDRRYRLGQAMAWWPHQDARFDSWRDDYATAPSAAEEACYSECRACGAEIFVVIRFRDLAPVEVLALGLEQDWPAGYTR